MEYLPLEILVKKYKVKLYRLGLEESKKFIDFTHNALGKMCAMHYYPRTKKFKLEPIQD